MNPGPVFDRVYTELKQQLTAGRWPPGSHLDPSAIGEDLGASITPVRDALHRLVGERIIEAPRQDGFWVAAITETQLRGLYAWRYDLLALALRSSLPKVRAIDTAPAFVGIEALFDAIAQRTGYPELAYANLSIGERLGAFGAAEAAALDGIEEEQRELTALFASCDTSALRRALMRYHRRRQRATPAILEARYRSVTALPQR